MDIRSDFHTHTNLSACAADEVTAQALIDGLCTGEDGLRVLGISNHLWDSDIEGASEWYKLQNVEHVISIRKELENVDTHGARILVGADDRDSKRDRLYVPHRFGRSKPFALPGIKLREFTKYMGITEDMMTDF